MELSKYLAGDEHAVPPRPKTAKSVFGRKINASAPLVTAYCDGSVFPRRDKHELIVRETGGLVTPNDFLSPAARKIIANVGAAQ